MQDSDNEDNFDDDIAAHDHDSDSDFEMCSWETVSTRPNICMWFFVCSDVRVVPLEANLSTLTINSANELWFDPQFPCPVNGVWLRSSTSASRVTQLPTSKGGSGETLMQRQLGSKVAAGGYVGVLNLTYLKPLALGGGEGMSPVIQLWWYRFLHAHNSHENFFSDVVNVKHFKSKAVIFLCLMRSRNAFKELSRASPHEYFHAKKWKNKGLTVSNWYALLYPKFPSCQLRTTRMEREGQTKG